MMMLIFHQAPVEGPHDETLTAAAEGWRSVYDALLRQDEKTMKGYQEDIDALLILVSDHDV
jgi:hypothetical protein